MVQIAFFDRDKQVTAWGPLTPPSVVKGHAIIDGYAFLGEGEDDPSPIYRMAVTHAYPGDTVRLTERFPAEFSRD